MRMKNNVCMLAELWKLSKPPLLTTGGMGEECKRFHSRLVELIGNKKGEKYGTTTSWIRCKVSFAILTLALLCLSGSNLPRRVPMNTRHGLPVELEKELAE